MSHPRAGRLAEPRDLVHVPRLLAADYAERPDAAERSQRVAFGTSGPLFLGQDTHTLPEPAFRTALEVLAGNGVTVRVDSGDGYTPTPVVSHAILSWNRDPDGPRAGEIVISPSHNPPGDGGFKYDLPHGGPAGTDATKAIEERANALLAAGLDGVKRVPFPRAHRAATTVAHACATADVDDLASVVDLEAIRSAGVKVGVDPL